MPTWQVSAFRIYSLLPALRRTAHPSSLPPTVLLFSCFLPIHESNIKNAKEEVRRVPCHVVIAPNLQVEYADTCTYLLPIFYFVELGVMSRKKLFKQRFSPKKKKKKGYTPKPNYTLTLPFLPLPKIFCQSAFGRCGQGSNPYPEWYLPNIVIE